MGHLCLLLHRILPTDCQFLRGSISAAPQQENCCRADKTCTNSNRMVQSPLNLTRHAVVFWRQNPDDFT